jgi:hypothetical protein
MDPFCDNDVTNIQAVKAAMAKKASGGDAQAALAFASLLQAETDRGKAIAGSAMEKTPPSVEGEGENKTRSWRDIIKTPDNPDGLAYVEASYGSSGQDCPS